MNKPSGSDDQKPKKQYHKPQMNEFGTIAEITQNDVPGPPGDPGGGSFGA